MTENTGKIIEKFNSLLSRPWLTSVKVTDPHSSNESDLKTLITDYYNKYQQLQIDTVPIARKILGYAVTQQYLLPSIGNEIALSDYLKANSDLVKQYETEANDVWTKTKKFQDDWQLFINSINAAIAQCDSQITTYNNSIDDLKEQQKNLILGAVFAGIGALIFTAAAFLGGGIVCALIGAALLAGTIAMAIAASKLTEAINGLRESVRTTQETKDHLNEALPIMNEIKGYLGDITTAWNTIVTQLTFINMQYEVWANSFTIYKLMVTKVVASWKEIENACNTYLNIVSKT